MVQIQNSDAIKIIRENARLSISEGFPQDLGKTIVPVMDMTPNFQRFINLVRTTTRTATGAATILTTSSTQRTFITGINLSVTADATADNTSAAVTMTGVFDNTARTVLQVNKQTTTAGSSFSSVNFPIPLELAKNSAIQHSSTFTVGACSYTTTFYGYVVDD